LKFHIPTQGLFDAGGLTAWRDLIVAGDGLFLACLVGRSWVGS
jgi:hypothetical protein